MRFVVHTYVRPVSGVVNVGGGMQTKLGHLADEMDKMAGKRVIQSRKHQWVIIKISCIVNHVKCS